jgi:hypothetical protein
MAERVRPKSTQMSAVLPFSNDVLVTAWRHLRLDA